MKEFYGKLPDLTSRLMKDLILIKRSQIDVFVERKGLPIVKDFEMIPFGRRELGAKFWDEMAT